MDFLVGRVEIAAGLAWFIFLVGSWVTIGQYFGRRLPHIELDSKEMKKSTKK